MRSRTFVSRLNLAFALTGVAGALLTTALISPVAADDAGNASGIRTATEQYQDVAAAEDAGYALLKDTAGIACIDSADGAMGIHYANGDLVAGGVIDALKPQVLVYEPGEGDELHLAAVEYVVIQEAWDASHDAAPELFGQEFMLTPEGNRYGLPAFYSLHDWAWKTNPDGEFAMYNPDVACPAALTAPATPTS
ncbi:MAG: hypothetical protein U0Z70_13965 [Thermomicrobiales bacterium]|nr:hypothetical protein [Chloroflexia bacterium]